MDHPYTVFGVYESTGQTWAEHYAASDPYDAMRKAAVAAKTRFVAEDLLILGAVLGQHELTPACDDSGNAAYAVDLVPSDLAGP